MKKNLLTAFKFCLARLNASFIVTLLLVFISGNVWGQTTVFTDDFNRATLSTGGTPSMTYTTGSGTAATVSSSYLTVYNSSSGFGYVTGSTSTFSTPYSTTLSSNTGLVTWSFNFRWNRSSSNNPAQPASGSYGQAIVLASSGANIANGSGVNGYAIVYGSSGTTDPIRLVRFTNGVAGTLTDIITSTSNDLIATNNYVSVKVTYDPADNKWSLYLRDDGATAWTDPASGTYTQKGSATVNNTYTSTALSNFGFLFSTAGSSSNVGDFDNYKVTVATAATCTAPTLPTTGSVTSSGATISWTAPTTTPAGGYDYYISTSPTAPTNGTTPTGTVNASASPVVLSTLASNTTYYWWVRSHCSSSDLGNWVAASSFTTPIAVGSFPYTDSFEGTNNWTLLNTSQTNKWMVGTAVANGGTNSLYISNTGTTHNYSISASSVSHAYRDIAIPTGTTTVSVGFDWRANGEGTTNKYDYLTIWLVPTTYTPTAGLTTASQTVTGKIKVDELNLVNTWGTYSKLVNISSFAGSNMRLVFEWQNDSNGGSQSPAAVDNVNITNPPPSTTVSVTSLTGFAATTVTDSAQQTFNVSGVALGSNTITITPPADYWISTTSGSGYASTPIVLTPTSGTVASTPIYVILKSSATIGAANGDITVSASPTVSPDKTVSLTGAITKATFTSVATGNWETAGTWDLNAVPGANDNVVIAAAHTVSANSVINRDSGTTTTVNGIFELKNGGYAGGTGAFTYGATATLQFNTDANYGVNNDHIYWPTTNSPSIVNVLKGGFTLNSASRTVNTISVANGGVALNNSTLTINTKAQINSGGFFNDAPTYAGTATLEYNNVAGFNIGNEWTGNATSVGVGIPNNVTLIGSSVNLTLGARAIPGTLTLSSSTSPVANSTFNASQVLTIGANLMINANNTLVANGNGDVYLAGNWTNAGVYTPNNKAVFFNGATGTQTITNTNATNLNTETFSYLINSKAAGTLSIASNVNISGTSGDVLQIIGGGSTSLNGANRTLSLLGNGGNILVSGAQRTIVSTASTGVMSINGTKTVRSTTGGTLVIGSFITTKLFAGIDFGVDLTTINNILEINSGGYVVNNAPIYVTGSSLNYNTGVATPYNVNNEWNADGTAVGRGIPATVNINTSNVNIPSGTKAVITALNINSGSTLTMANGSTVNDLGTVTIASGGTFGLNTNATFTIVKSWTNNGTFNANNGLVSFVGTMATTPFYTTLNGATTFDYLKIDKTGDQVQLAANIIINKDLSLVSRNIDLKTFNITFPNNTSIITSSTTSYITATGTGQLIRQNIDGSKDWLFPVGAALTGRYAPITIKNLSGSTELRVNVASSISPAVADVTKVLSTKWFATTTNTVTANIAVEWQPIAAEVNSVTIPSAGKMGVTVGGNPYAFYDVNLVASNTQATGVSLSNSATNGIVVGGDNAISLANDECSGAVNVVVDAAAISGTVVGASTSIAATCGGIVASDVWYKFTTTDAGYYKINVQGTISGFDSVLELRSGPCSGASIACVDNTSGGGLETITQLLAENTTYYYRIYRYSNTTIADNTFTTSVTTLPGIIVTPANLAYGDVDFDTTSTQDIKVKASFLNPNAGNISIAALTGYEYSLDGTTWSTTLSLPYTAKTLAETTVHVRFHPTFDCVTTYNGNISVSGGGATVVNVAVTGRGIVKANAGTDATATTFTAHWNAVAGAAGYELDVYKKTVGPNATDLIISEYVEGSSNNKYLEIFNGTGADVDLSNYRLRLYSNGNSSADSDIVLSGILPNNSTKVYKNSSAALTLPSGVVADNNAALAFNGDDAIALYKISTNANVDIFGRIGNDPGTAWISGSLTTLDKTLVRKSSVLGGVTVSPTGTGSGAFTTLGTEWDMYNFDVVSNLGSHTFDGGTVYTYVTNYHSQVISGGSTTSHVVTGLEPNTQYYYVVRAINGSCKSINSNEIAVTTNNSVIWDNNAWSNTAGPGNTGTLDAEIRAPYIVGVSGGEFATNNLTINATAPYAGFLHIKANTGITVNGNITTPDATIVGTNSNITGGTGVVIDSDGSLVQTNNSANNSANKIIALRAVKMLTTDYTYWSSPVKDQPLLNTSNVNATNSAGGFSPGSPNNRIYVYNEPDDTFIGTTDAIFVKGKGYAIRGKSGYGTTALFSDVLSFNGELHNGNHNITIQRTPDSTDPKTAEVYEHGYNMIGNPYPSNIDFIKFFNLPKDGGGHNYDVINGKAWFWTNVPGAPTNQGGSKYTGNNYAILSLAGGAPATGVDANETIGSPIPTQHIKLGQGFIVQARSVGTNQTLKFDNSIRDNGAGYFYNNNKSTSDINRFWLKLISPNSVVNTILLAHVDGATSSYDADYDAELLTIADDSFYSILNTQKLQIQAKEKLVNTENKFFLGTKYSMNGNYKIKLGNIEGAFDGQQKIYLKDKLLNKEIDLTSQDYEFSASKGLDESRFEIVYKPSEVLAANSLIKDDLQVYKDGDSFVVRSSSNIKVIEIFDISGRVIEKLNITTGKEARFNNIKLNQSAYVLKIYRENDIRTKKIVN